MQELSFAEIMSYATIAEDNAIAFYKGAAAKASQPSVKKYLEELAAMELGHKRHLEELVRKFEKSKRIPKLHKEIHSLGYAEFIKPITLDADASYKDALEAGMVKEREAVATYEKLAIYVDDPDAKQVFKLLLEEEKKHLKRFETEYDDLTNQNW
ncbi:MAG: ferritin family protein [Candidatus Methylomirabilia bacterium]